MSKAIDKRDFPQLDAKVEKIDASVRPRNSLFEQRKASFQRKYFSGFETRFREEAQ